MEYGSQWVTYYLKCVSERVISSGTDQMKHRKH
jgi:hypothetical protein